MSRPRDFYEPWTWTPVQDIEKNPLTEEENERWNSDIERYFFPQVLQSLVENRRINPSLYRELKTVLIRTPADYNLSGTQQSICLLVRLAVRQVFEGLPSSCGEQLAKEIYGCKDIRTVNKNIPPTRSFDFPWDIWDLLDHILMVAIEDFYKKGQPNLPKGAKSY